MKYFSTVMGSSFFLLCASLVVAQGGPASLVQAQQSAAAANATPIVPPLVNFSGVLTDLDGRPMTGVVGVTFLLYKDAQGGAPLWLETQNMRLDRTGHYTAMLGSASSHGLPAEIFVAGEAHWLGVQVSGQAEQPRVLLVSAPYALKAGDAETVGGFPASAFMLAAPAAGPGTAGAAAASSQSASVTVNITGSGTAGYVPLWDSTSDITNSALFQSGSGTTAKVGINTTTPTAALDVHGAGTIRGTLSLPVTGNATATAGKNSQALSLAASAFNSTSSAATNQTFQWVAEPAGNDTSTPSGTLDLLFGEGTTAPAETGLQIASNGQITFAAGQSFPITGTGGGTITGVTAGSGLTGGGTSGTVTLGLDTTSTDTRYARLTANNTFNGRQTINNTANLTASSTGEALNVTQTGTGATGDAIHGITSATGGTGVFGEGAIGIQGLANPSTGLSALFRGTVKTTGNGNDMMAGDPGCGSGYAGLGFTTGSLTGCTNYALLGGSKGDTYINSNGTATIHFRSNNNELMTIDNNGNVKIIGQNSGGNLTVAGNLTVTGQPSGDGVKGESPNVGVYGSSEGASVTGQGRGKAGVWGDSGGTAGAGFTAVLGTADANSAGVFANNGIYPSLIARNFGVGNGLQASTTGSGNGVEGSTTGSGYGVEGTSPNVGVHGIASGPTLEGIPYGSLAGVWGDSAIGVGILGTAGDNEAGAFYSKTQDNFTMLVENDVLTDEKGDPTIIFDAQGGVSITTFLLHRYQRERELRRRR